MTKKQIIKFMKADGIMWVNPEKSKKRIVKYLCWTSKFIPDDVKASQGWQKRVGKVIADIGL